MSKVVDNETTEDSSPQSSITRDSASSLVTVIKRVENNSNRMGTLEKLHLMKYLMVFYLIRIISEDQPSTSGLQNSRCTRPNKFLFFFIKLSSVDPANFHKFACVNHTKYFASLYINC